MSDVQIGSRAHREVGFVEAFSLFFKNYVNFGARSSRGAYWWWFLWSIIISFGLAFIEGLVFGLGLEGAGSGPASILFSFATLIPGISIGVRRLHDMGRSGWWLLIALIPLVGIILLIVWFCQPGQDGTNKYGPDVEAGRNDVDPIANTFN